MKKLFSTRYSPGAFNTAIFFLRVVSGFLLINHGYDKMVHFAEYKDHFMNFMGLGTTISLSLTIFAEFFCSLFIILGLFTRLAAIPLVIAMSVVFFKVTHSDFYGKGELPALYLVAFLAILILGPGRASIDSMVGKN